MPFIFLVSICSVFLRDGWLIYEQYRVWAGNEFTQFLLPEHRPGYFIFYVFFGILASDILALVVALALLFVLTKINNRASQVFFEQYEPYLASTTLFVVGFPGLLFYLIWLLLVYFIWHMLIVGLTGGTNKRLSLHSLWPLVGVVTILMNEYWLEGTVWWSKLIFSR